MIKLCGAVCIVAGTTCYGLFYAFQKKSRLWRLKQFKESLLCLSGQLRVARMTMPQALAQSQKSVMITFHSFTSLYRKIWNSIHTADSGKRGRPVLTAMSAIFI